MMLTCIIFFVCVLLNLYYDEIFYFNIVLYNLVKLQWWKHSICFNKVCVDWASNWMTQYNTDQDLFHFTGQYCMPFASFTHSSLIHKFIMINSQHFLWCVCDLYRTVCFMFSSACYKKKIWCSLTVYHYTKSDYYIYLKHQNIIFLFTYCICISDSYLA